MAIVSFLYNFVFIKKTKTAGTSIEIDLDARIEQEAIVTPILPVVARHRPRNHSDGRFYDHMPATQIRKLLGQHRFSRMILFCVEREPVDKCISHFHMLRNSQLHNPDGHYNLDWESYCRAARFPIDHAKYSDDDKLLVNHVLRYERLGIDLPPLMAELGLPDLRLTARAKSDYRYPELVRPDQVTEDQRATILAAFADTCRLTGLYC
ncbi:MAG: hypothetical protein JJU15_04865 [Pararhodobacter sp.]|nr:hypothetical protein [Pararhodobacter sp.]